MNVQSRAKRILAPLGSYTSIDNIDEPLLAFRDTALLNGAVPVGVYFNTSREWADAILVSDIGIFLSREQEVLFIQYDSIKCIDVAKDGNLLASDQPDSKFSANGLLLTLGAAEPVFLPVRNGRGQYRDAFEFSRFLSRVVENLKSSETVRQSHSAEVMLHSAR